MMNSVHYHYTEWQNTAATESVRTKLYQSQ